MHLNEVLNKNSLAKADENAIRPAVPCIVVSIGGESEAAGFCPPRAQRASEAPLRAVGGHRASERAAINHHARGKTFYPMLMLRRGKKNKKQNKSSCACIVALMTKLCASAGACGCNDGARCVGFRGS